MSIFCDVYVSLPGIDHEAVKRLQMALHSADRRLGVAIGGRAEGVVFILMTREPDEESARSRAYGLLTQAAAVSAISQQTIDGCCITKIVRRQRDPTGKPRRVEAPAAAHRSIDVAGRGRLHASHEGPLGEWIVYLAADPSHAIAGRDLFGVLWELFELPHGRQDPWLYDLIEDLAGHRTALGVRYPCPCCDLLTLSSPPSGSFEICDVCGWEDDNIQFCNPDYTGGANRSSLREARANMQRYGVSEHKYLKRARAALPDEKP